VFPLVFGFFGSIEIDGAPWTPDIASYLDFITSIVLAFGIAFEVPIATLLLVWAGLTTTQTLAKARPYVFLMAFVVGMLLTPPDVISQTLLAVPVYLLFEAGIIMARLFVRKTVKEAEPSAE
jgi:sec-independent protein translocase protein TatC